MSDDSQGWNRETALEALREVADRLDDSPSRREYDAERHDHEPSAGAVIRIFGTWNDAKREAGLETYPLGSSIRSDAAGSTLERMDVDEFDEVMRS